MVPVTPLPKSNGPSTKDPWLRGRPRLVSKSTVFALADPANKVKAEAAAQTRFFIVTT